MLAPGGKKRWWTLRGKTSTIPFPVLAPHREEETVGSLNLDRLASSELPVPGQRRCADRRLRELAEHVKSCTVSR